jgi:hypothetical protein
MGEESQENPGDTTLPRRWHGAFTWSSLIVAGFVIYELTNQPAVGTAVLCSKFGFEDFKTAHWIRRYDPRRARGRVYWWLYIAWGLSKIGIGSYLISHLFIGGMAISGIPKDRLVAHFSGAMLMVGLGLLLSAFATLMAVFLARRNGVRLWLDGKANRARRENYWPPYDPAACTQSFVGHLTAISGVVFILLLSICSSLVLLILCSLLGDKALAAWAGLSILAVPVLYVFWRRFCKPLLATSPDQCWSLEEVAANPDDPVQ